MSGTVNESYAGRVAVITGASRGLGAGLAERFAEAGLRLGLCARTEPGAPARAAGAGPAGSGASAAGPSGASGSGSGADGVLTAAVDVADAAAVDRFAAAVAERFGQIDLWINNAGVLRPIAPLREAPVDELAAHVRTNVEGVLYGSRAYARHVRSRRGGGVLVNMSSGAATSAYPGWAAYCGSKAAVDQITRVVAVEERDAGLRAHAVAPGVVDTDMQALIRSTPAEDFPAVGRFRQLAEDDAFNTPRWVADQLLALAFGDAGPSVDVVWRIPDEG